MSRKRLPRDSAPFQKAIPFEIDKIELCTSGRFGREGANETELAELMDYLDAMTEQYASVMHSAWQLNLTGNDAGQIKAALMAQYPIKARVANAAISQATTQYMAYTTLRESQMELLENKVADYEKRIDQQVQAHQEWHASVNWGRPEKGDCELNRDWKSRISKMKQRLNNLKMHIEHLKAHANEYCFGTRKLFLAQYHLEENGFASHEEWLAAWREARTRSFFLLGSSSETQGNQLCQLNAAEDDWFSMRLRSGFRDDKMVYTFDVHIPYLSAELAANLAGQKSVSYRFVRKKSSWYIQAYVSMECMQVYKPKGMLGIDINNGFVSVAQVDADGSFLGVTDMDYPVGNSKSVNRSGMKELLCTLFRVAKSDGCGVAVEGINLTRKKSKSQKGMGTSYNAMLSGFPYREYLDACESLSVRMGVPLFYVNPAYTSVLGEKKYMVPLGLTRHEAAAYVIGRRALGIREWYTKPRKGAANS